MDVISDIVSLVDTIQDHAFGYRDHLGHDFVQNADDRARVAIVRAPVDDEGEQFIGQFFFIGKRTENVWHG